MMKIKKTHLFFLLLIICYFNIFFTSVSQAEDMPVLPLISGWEVTNEQIKELKTEKMHLGWYIEQDINSQVHQQVKVILLTGSGPGSLYIPEGNISNDDRPIGFGATYSTLEIMGLKGVLENYPYVGMALSIRISPQSTLTLESRTLSRKKLISLTTEYIKRISDLSEPLPKS